MDAHTDSFSGVEHLDAGQYAMLALFAQAVSLNNLELVQQLLAQEPRLATATGWHKQTELHKACIVGNLEAVKLLIKAGADPNARNDFDETPLLYACKRASPFLLHYLISCGGDVSLLDKSGKGVLHHAAESNSVPILAMLEALYPDISFMCQDYNLQTPLHLAVKDGRIEVFRFLLKKRRSNLHCADKDGNWPIHIACQQGYGNMVWELLCLQGPSILEHVNNEGFTPPKLASLYDTPSHKELLKELDWIRCHPGVSSIQQHALQLWYWNLLMPVISFGAAIVLSLLLPIFQALIFFPVIGLNLHTMGSSLHRMQHICRWPHPFSVGAYGAGIFHTFLVYYCVVFPYTQDHILFNVFTNFAVFVLVATFIRLLTKDPGILRKTAVDETTGKPLTILDVCSSLKWNTYCADCELVMPARTKHCKLCQVCTMEMDHHCLFLQRCIAKHNHCLFAWLLIVCECCVLMFLYSCYLYVTRAYTAHPSWLQVLWLLLGEDGWLLTMLILNVFSAFWGISLLGFQYHIVSNGYTAYFAPRRYHGNILSCYEKLMNVGKFLIGGRPYVVNPSLRVFEQSLGNVI